MNASPLNKLYRIVSTAGVAAGLTLAAAGAHAGGGVYWSVNVNAPVQGVGVSTSFSNTRHGVYGVAPVAYVPAQVVYAPAPVVYAPAPVVYSPPVVVERTRLYVPAPQVVYAPRCEPRAWGWRHHHRDDRYAWNEGWRGEDRMPGPRDDDGRSGWRHGR